VNPFDDENGSFFVLVDIRPRSLREKLANGRAFDG